MMVKQADYQMYIEEDGRGITKTNMLKQVPVPPHGGKLQTINDNIYEYRRALYLAIWDR